VSDAEEADRERALAVGARGVRPIGRNRDKRSATGRRRYVRQVGDHTVLRAACDGHLNDHKWRCARGEAGGVCPSCGGAMLTPEEKRDAAPPG